MITASQITEEQMGKGNSSPSLAQQPFPLPNPLQNNSQAPRTSNAKACLVLFLNTL